MENTLGRLIEKIYQEGIEKAEERASAILAQAKEEASLIREKAKREAVSLLEAAKQEAQLLKTNTEAELALAATAALARLRQAIVELIQQKVLVEPISQITHDGEFLKKVILTLIENQAGEYNLVVSPEIKQELEKYFQEQVVKSLPGLTITVGKKGGGFVLEKKEDGYALDFSEEALVAFFTEFLKPTTKALFCK